MASATSLDEERGIDQLAVDLAGQRSLCQTGTDGRSDLGDRHGLLETAYGTVGQGDIGHNDSLAKILGKKKVRTSRTFSFSGKRLTADSSKLVLAAASSRHSFSFLGVW
jgi:hypothetical protein